MKNCCTNAGRGNETDEIKIYKKLTQSGSDESVRALALKLEFPNWFQLQIFESVLQKYSPHSRKSPKMSLLKINP